MNSLKRIRDSLLEIVKTPQAPKMGRIPLPEVKEDDLYVPSDPSLSEDSSSDSDKPVILAPTPRKPLKSLAIPPSPHPHSRPPTSSTTTTNTNTITTTTTTTTKDSESKKLSSRHNPDKPPRSPLDKIPRSSHDSVDRPFQERRPSGSSHRRPPTSLQHHHHHHHNNNNDDNSDNSPSPSSSPSSSSPPSSKSASPTAPYIPQPPTPDPLDPPPPPHHHQQQQHERRPPSSSHQRRLSASAAQPMANPSRSSAHHHHQPTASLSVHEASQRVSPHDHRRGSGSSSHYRRPDMSTPLLHPSPGHQLLPSSSFSPPLPPPSASSSHSSDSSFSTNSQNGGSSRLDPRPRKGILKPAPVRQPSKVSLHWQLLPHIPQKKALFFDVGQDPIYIRDHTRPSSPIQHDPEEMEKPAADVSLTIMTIKIRILAHWEITACNPGGLSCRDVFDAIYNDLQEPLTDEEMKNLVPVGSDARKAAVGAFDRRCRITPGIVSPPSSPVVEWTGSGAYPRQTKAAAAAATTKAASKGSLSRVDLLGEKTIFIGLTLDPSDRFWVLELGKPK